MQKIRLLSLFSGIGAFEEALKNIGINYELINYCEFDEKIAKAYSLIHNIDECLNLGDVTKIDETKLEDFDLMTYGFPCQSFSIAGKRLGFEDETRGSLFFESMRIAKHKKPKYMIAENVKGLINHDKGKTFKTILETLNLIGYNNYYKVLRSCDFGVPHARERVFIISIRKDIDNYKFLMPVGKITNKTLKDVIEDKPRKEMKKNLQIYNNEIYFTKEYISDMNIKKLFDGVEEGYFSSGFTSNRIFSINGTSPTLTTKNDAVYSEINGHLTGRERFKLQGFNPDYVDKLLKNGISKGLIDKVSGNSITVNVLEEIFKNLFFNN
jgi:DNA (cytosine-5)-methyltransferase 1